MICPRQLGPDLDAKRVENAKNPHQPSAGCGFSVQNGKGYDLSAAPFDLLKQCAFAIRCCQARQSHNARPNPEDSWPLN